MTEAQSDRRKKMSRESTKLADDVKNPCLKESDMSYDCMNENGFDKDKCSIYFKNYRNCMDFWNRVSRDRRQQGIKPALPLPVDRDTVKQEYYLKWAHRN